MHFFHTEMYQFIKLILKPVKIFKTLQHVPISYEIETCWSVLSILTGFNINSMD